jgi:thioredoxin 1
MNQDIEYIILETRDDLRSYLKNTNSQTTIIKLTASWCGPCKRIQPYIEQLNEKYKEVDYEYIEIDVDHAVDLYSFFKKMKMANGIPTMLCFKKRLYSDSTYYVPYKCMTGADSNLISNFFQLCLE